MRQDRLRQIAKHPLNAVGSAKCALHASSIFARIHIEGRFRHRHDPHTRTGAAEYGFGAGIALEIAKLWPEPARQNYRNAEVARIPRGDRLAWSALPGVDEAL